MKFRPRQYNYVSLACDEVVSDYGRTMGPIFSSLKPTTAISHSLPRTIKSGDLPTNIIDADVEEGRVCPPHSRRFILLPSDCVKRPLKYGKHQNYYQEVRENEKDEPHKTFYKFVEMECITLGRCFGYPIRRITSDKEGLDQKDSNTNFIFKKEDTSASCIPLRKSLTNKSCTKFPLTSEAKRNSSSAVDSKSLEIQRHASKRSRKISPPPLKYNEKISSTLFEKGSFSCLRNIVHPEEPVLPSKSSSTVPSSSHDLGPRVLLTREVEASKILLACEKVQRATSAGTDNEVRRWRRSPTSYNWSYGRVSLHGLQQSPSARIHSLSSLCLPLPSPLNEGSKVEIERCRRRKMTLQFLKGSLEKVEEIFRRLQGVDRDVCCSFGSHEYNYCGQNMIICLDPPIPPILLGRGSSDSIIFMNKRPDNSLASQILIDLSVYRDGVGIPPQDSWLQKQQKAPESTISKSINSLTTTTIPPELFFLKDTTVPAPLFLSTHSIPSKSFQMRRSSNNKDDDEITLCQNPIPQPILQSDLYLPFQANGLERPPFYTPPLKKPQTKLPYAARSYVCFAATFRMSVRKSRSAPMLFFPRRSILVTLRPRTLSCSYIPHDTTIHADVVKRVFSNTVRASKRGVKKERPEVVNVRRIFLANRDPRSLVKVKNDIYRKYGYPSAHVWLRCDEATSLKVSTTVPREVPQPRVIHQARVRAAAARGLEAIHIALFTGCRSARDINGNCIYRCHLSNRVVCPEVYRRRYVVMLASQRDRRRRELSLGVDMWQTTARNSASQSSQDNREREKYSNNHRFMRSYRHPLAGDLLMMLAGQVYYQSALNGCGSRWLLRTSRHCHLSSSDNGATEYSPFAPGAPENLYGILPINIRDEPRSCHDAKPPMLSYLHVKGKSIQEEQLLLRKELLHLLDRSFALISYGEAKTSSNSKKRKICSPESVLPLPTSTSSHVTEVDPLCQKNDRGRYSKRLRKERKKKDRQMAQKKEQKTHGTIDFLGEKQYPSKDHVISSLPTAAQMGKPNSHRHGNTFCLSPNVKMTPVVIDTKNETTSTYHPMNNHYLKNDTITPVVKISPHAKHSTHHANETVDFGIKSSFSEKNHSTLDVISQLSDIDSPERIMPEIPATTEAIESISSEEKVQKSGSSPKFSIDQDKCATTFKDKQKFQRSFPMTPLPGNTPLPSLGDRALSSVSETEPKVSPLHASALLDKGPLRVLCGEHFLEAFSAAATELLSGAWVRHREVPGSSQNEKEDEPRVQTCHSIETADCPLVDEAGTSFELPGRNAIGVHRLSDWYSTSDRRRGGPGVRDAVRTTVLLMALGRYDAIHLILCVDIKIDTEVAADMVLFQNSIVPQNGCPCKEAEVNFINEHILAFWIGRKVVEICCRYSNNVDRSVSTQDGSHQKQFSTVSPLSTPWECSGINEIMQEKITFLMSLAPSLTIRGTIGLLRFYDSIADNNDGRNSSWRNLFFDLMHRGALSTYQLIQNSLGKSSSLLSEVTWLNINQLALSLTTIIPGRKR